MANMVSHNRIQDPSIHPVSREFLQNLPNSFRGRDLPLGFDDSKSHVESVSRLRGDSSLAPSRSDRRELGFFHNAILSFRFFAPTLEADSLGDLLSILSRGEEPLDSRDPVWSSDSSSHPSSREPLADLADRDLSSSKSHRFSNDLGLSIVFHHATANESKAQGRNLGDSLPLSAEFIESIPSPLRDDLPLPLCDQGEKTSEEKPRRGARIEVLGDRDEFDASLLQSPEEVVESPRSSSSRPIEFRDNDDRDLFLVEHSEEPLDTDAIEGLCGLSIVGDDLEKSEPVEPRILSDLGSLSGEGDPFHLVACRDSNISDRGLCLETLHPPYIYRLPMGMQDPRQRISGG